MPNPTCGTVEAYYFILSLCPHTHSHHTIFLPPPFSSSISLSLSILRPASDYYWLTAACIVYMGDSSSSRCVWGGGRERGLNMLLGDGESPSYYLLATYIKSKGLPRKPTSCVMLYAYSVLVCNVNSGHLLCCAVDNNDQLLLVLITPSTDVVIICEQSSCVVFML